MKVKIEKFNGELSDYLTVGKIITINLTHTIVMLVDMRHNSFID